MTDVRDPGAPVGADEAESDDATGPGEGAPAAAPVAAATAAAGAAGAGAAAGAAGADAAAAGAIGGGAAAGPGAARPAPASGVVPGTGPGWLAPATGPAARTRRAGRRPGWRLGLVGVVLAAAVGFLLYEGIGTSLDYYVTVRQALARHGALVGKTFRLQGIVVPGTISHRGDTVAFTVAQPGDRHLQIPVVNHGNPPQLFKKGVPVIVQGHFAGSTFESTQLLVDHTGNYSPQRDGPRNGASSTASAGSTPAGSAGAGAAGAGARATGTTSAGPASGGG